MTDRNKFEQMLEHLINDESDKAKEIFHQLVVEKSREIYENILAEDFSSLEEKKDEDEEDMDEAKEEDDEELDEAADEEDDEQQDESFGFAEGEDEEAGDNIGGDAGDDMIDDLDSEGDDDMDMGGDGDLEDRVVDLEDALDELKAEFEQLMSGEEGMDDMGGDDMGMDDMGGDDMEMGMDDEEEKMSFEAGNFMREYIEKVSAKMGDDGVNNKSIVAGKNDMGGTSANIAKSFSSDKGGTQGGLLNPSTKDLIGDVMNRPNSDAGKKAFKKKEPGHGAEKKGTAEQADNKTSMLNGAPKRAK